MAIKLHPTVSSNISAAGYDPETKTMEVQFANGAKYQYTNVPKEVYEGMWTSESIGKYVREHISSKFKYKKTGAIKK